MAFFHNESQYSSRIQKLPQFSKISADNVRMSAPFSMSGIERDETNTFHTIFGNFNFLEILAWERKAFWFRNNMAWWSSKFKTITFEKIPWKASTSLHVNNYLIDTYEVKFHLNIKSQKILIESYACLMHNFSQNPDAEKPGCCWSDG